MLDRNASKMLSEVGIDEGQSVLDFGCGSGTYSIPAAKLVGKNGRIYSLDVSQGALQKLSKKAEREGLDNIVTLLSSGNDEIPIDNETQNHVLLIDVLQEISNKKSLLGEIHRILKPDGLMTPSPFGCWGCFGGFLGLFFGFGGVFGFLFCVVWYCFDTG